jgi:hypothetical protein
MAHVLGLLQGGLRKAAPYQAMSPLRTLSLVLICHGQLFSTAAVSLSSSNCQKIGPVSVLFTIIQISSKPRSCMLPGMPGQTRTSPFLPCFISLATTLSPC